LGEPLCASWKKAYPNQQTQNASCGILSNSLTPWSEIVERTFVADRDWASIDGRLCLVTAFVPMAKVANRKVVAISSTTPYGSLHLKCEDLPEDITGFISHKTDFAMLWAAFCPLPRGVPGTAGHVPRDR
jgi:hypothetical protein